MKAPRPAFLICAYYFFYFGAVGCLAPYIAIYYQRVGLSGEQIGWLSGLGPIVLLLSGPLWGAIGDRFNLHRQLLPLATVGVIIPTLIMAHSARFGPLVVLVLLLSFFSTAIGPLMDSAALEISEITQVPFGRLRIWGSIGFTLIATALGWLLKWIGVEWLFYSYAACMAMAALVALPLPARQHHWRAPIQQGFQQLLAQPSFIIFLGAALLVGASIMAVSYFFPLHIKAIGGDTNLIGLANAVAALAEMPVLFRADTLLKRVGGLWAALVISTAAYVARWWFLASATTPAAILLLQLMHSVTFGLFLVASIAYVNAQAPKGLSATAQSLLIAAMWGVGPTLGAIGGGVIYARYGAPTLFRLASAVTVAALGLLLVLRFVKHQPSTAIELP